MMKALKAFSDLMESQMTGLILNLPIITFIAIASPSGIVRAGAIIALLFAIVGIVRLRMIPNIEGKRDKSSFATIAYLTQIVIVFAGLSTLPEIFLFSSEMTLSLAAFMLVILVWQAVSRGMFILNLQLMGEEGYARHKAAMISRMPRIMGWLHYAWIQNMASELTPKHMRHAFLLRNMVDQKVGVR